MVFEGGFGIGGWRRDVVGVGGSDGELYWHLASLDYLHVRNTTSFCTPGYSEAEGSSPLNQRILKTKNNARNFTVRSSVNLLLSFCRFR